MEGKGGGGRGRGDQIMEGKGEGGLNYGGGRRRQLFVLC